MSSSRYLALALAGVALGVFGISISLYRVTNAIENGSYAGSPPPTLGLGALLALGGFLLALFAAVRCKD